MVHNPLFILRDGGNGGVQQPCLLNIDSLISNKSIYVAVSMGMAILNDLNAKEVA